jgi:nitroimidazol reductase NimA-like FMN-containing flavoprotein (pyridoxamine 5'-phosphate oxidase superfamily)
MLVHELSEEEREQLVEMMFKKIDVERKRLTKKELEKEIIDYLDKKHPCSLATCSKDGVPRTSVVDYVNEGLTIYIMSEGGGKFKNLKENNKVSIGIGTSARALMSVRGVNIWGTAEVFTEETPEFAHGVELFKPIFEDLERTLKEPVEMPKGMMRLIRVTPTKMVYFHNKKGIANAHWKAE